MNSGQRALRTRLLRWYRDHRRDLPWRRTRDPYAIWVAEIMLQQTQVATVVPYYRRFLKRFPDPIRLARADIEEVLSLWSGLGYYRRARALHAAARTMLERHGGRVPADPEALLELPGVGRYTAGAIASIAFDLPRPILDGNVRRVLCRVFAIDGRRLGPAREERALWDLAARLVDGAEPGQLNQALMELGALVCTPVAPRCDACPVRGRCRSFAAGLPEALPFRRPAPPRARVDVGVAWIVRSDRLLLERPAEGGPLRGTWDVPAVERAAERPLTGMIEEGLARAHGLQVKAGQHLARLSHGIMNRRLQLEVFRCRLSRGRVADHPQLRWVALDDIRSAAVSGATRKVIDAVLRSSPGPRRERGAA